MQKLPKGFHTKKAHRHTHSTIYQVHQGSGYTVINGVRFDWSKGDYFVVPNWHGMSTLQKRLLLILGKRPTNNGKTSIWNSNKH